MASYLLQQIRQQCQSRRQKVKNKTKQKIRNLSVCLDLRPRNEMESLKIKSLRVICRCAYPNVVFSLSEVSNYKGKSETLSEKKKKLKELEEKAIIKVQDQLRKLGVYSNYLIEFLWQEYNRVRVEKRPDIYIFLDAILNQSFSSLQLCSSHFKDPKTKSWDITTFDLIKLLDLIKRKCPSLQVLSLILPRSMFSSSKK